jgi:hypothetical protein
MLSARREEMFPVEDDAKKGEGPIYTRVELRLTRLEDKVTVIATDVAELKRDVKDLRKEVNDGGQSLRKEISDGDQSLRKEMYVGFESIRKEISNAKIWALLIAAAMLGVLARGFHWI